MVERFGIFRMIIVGEYMSANSLASQNMSDNGSAASALRQSGAPYMRLLLLSDNQSQVSLKEKSVLHLDDMSLPSGGGSAMDAIPENMDIDNGSLMDGLDQQSLHVQFDLDDQSLNGSVATALVEPQEEATPPSSPRGAVIAPAAEVSKGKASQKKRRKKKKRKARCDAQIELRTAEMRADAMESAPFMHPDWPFDEPLKQPLSRSTLHRRHRQAIRAVLGAAQAQGRRRDGRRRAGQRGHSARARRRRKGQRLRERRGAGRPRPTQR